MCAPTCVQLHVVEELLNMLDLDNFVDTQMQAVEAHGDTVMAISLSAVTGGVLPRPFSCVFGFKEERYYCWLTQALPTRSSMSS